MNSDLEISLQLLLVGMTTVFVILLIVVLSSKLLIALVNRFEPETAIKESNSSARIPNEIQTVIAKAVHEISAGRARIEKIEKLD